MKNDSNIVSAAVLSDWALMGLRRVRELAEAGIFVKAGRGRYDLKASLQGLIKHQRELAAGRAGLDPSTDIASANMRLKEANIRLANLRYDKESGTLIEKDVVLQNLGPIMRGIMRFVMGIPGTYAFEVGTLLPADKAILERICRDGLHDCSLQRGFDFDAKAPDDSVEEVEEGDNDA
jgi:phage terminase Nu1 subunit (DNA packaging protein)